MNGGDRPQNSSAPVGRAEIDTKAPFKSVKEAVALFGEKVLVGEIYAKQLKEIGIEESDRKPAQPKFGDLKAELEETKQNLDQAKEDTRSMEHCISSLRDEIRETKIELLKLKAKDNQKQPLLEEVKKEDLKFIETPKMIKVNIDDKDEKAKNRSVKFASPPSIIVDQHFANNRSSSVKRTKTKPLLPIFGWFFAKKKSLRQSGQSPVVDAFC